MKSISKIFEYKIEIHFSDIRRGMNEMHPVQN